MKPSDNPAPPPPALAALLTEYRETERAIDQLMARAELQAARQRHTARKHDTRRKIIVGGAILAALRDGSPESQMILDLLNRRINAVRDRVIVAETIPLGPAPSVSQATAESLAPDFPPPTAASAPAR